MYPDCYFGMAQEQDCDVRTRRHWDKKAKESTAAAIKTAQLRETDKEAENDLVQKS